MGYPLVSHTSDHPVMPWKKWVSGTYNGELQPSAVFQLQLFGRNRQKSEHTSSLSINVSDLALYDSGIQEAFVEDTQAFVSLILVSLPNSFGRCNVLERCCWYTVVCNPADPERDRMLVFVLFC